MQRFVLICAFCRRHDPWGKLVQHSSNAHRSVTMPKMSAIHIRWARLPLSTMPNRAGKKCQVISLAVAMTAAHPLLRLLLVFWCKRLQGLPWTNWGCYCNHCLKLREKRITFLRGWSGDELLLMNKARIWKEKPSGRFSNEKASTKTHFRSYLQHEHWPGIC